MIDKENAEGKGEEVDDSDKRISGQSQFWELQIHYKEND